MIQELIQEHAGEVTKLLSSKYGLNENQASGAASTITNSVSSFLSGQLSSGKLDLSNVADLFNKGTANQGNPLFSQISGVISNALSSNSGLSKDLISQISSGGLDDILKIFQGGKLGNIDMNAITQIAGAFTGKGDGLGDMLGNLGGLFGKK